MTARVSKFVVVGCLLAFCVVSGQGLYSSAPDFRAYSPTLKAAVQLAKLRGKPVVLNFWGSWCGPCREEMPDFNAVAGQLKDKFVLLALASGESPDVSVKYVTDNKFDQITILSDAPKDDPNDLETSQTINQRYGVRGYPTSFFIDADGIVQASREGGLSRKSLLSYLRNVNVAP
jgi:thiol-disulfide isomerase/thioredoxin